MKTKVKIVLISSVVIISIFGAYFMFESNFENKDNRNTNEEKIELSGSLFKIFVDPEDIRYVEGKTISTEKASFALKDGLESTYAEIGVFELEQKPVVILPTFTNSAYEPNGFYDYYQDKCDEKCLTVKVNNEYSGFVSSRNGIQVLKLLGYETISDIQLHKNPEILSKYQKIILLHNEYVTKEMFNAITSHPNVIYLYPNALHAEIKYDEKNDEIKLVRGHGYPNSSIDNGFDWKFDNTRPYEFDTECVNWEFYEIDNGVMLNCFPEHIIWNDVNLLKSLKSR